jgi:hypothetical protein
MRASSVVKCQLIGAIVSVLLPGGNFGAHGFDEGILRRSAVGGRMSDWETESTELGHTEGAEAEPKRVADKRCEAEK